jgi:hypothetical protein
MTQCPFCQLESSRIISECGCAIAIRDGFPVTEGHTLVVPRRHIESIFGIISFGDHVHKITWRVRRRSEPKHNAINPYGDVTTGFLGEFGKRWKFELRICAESARNGIISAQASF